ncbi:hypothetical protein L1280_002328 [Deinococcus sp. HSC-46F16]|nr:hypothetical protein [Deinococcus sp. HSC-46F16]
MSKTLNRFEVVDYECMSETQKISLAIIIVESWFRPMHVRAFEYLLLMTGFNPTTGLCQARYNNVWLSRMPVDANLFIKFLSMEDLNENLKTVESFLESSVCRENLIAVVKKYNGVESRYYLKLLETALSYIDSR